MDVESSASLDGDGDRGSTKAGFRRCCVGSGGCDPSVGAGTGVKGVLA